MYSVAGGIQVYSVAGGIQVYSVAGGVQVYSVAGGIQVYSVAGGIQVYSIAGGIQVYSVAGGIQVYSVAGGMQVYSVTNYSTCCFLLHLQLSKNYIKELTIHTKILHHRERFIFGSPLDERSVTLCYPSPGLNGPYDTTAFANQ